MDTIIFEAAVTERTAGAAIQHSQVTDAQERGCPKKPKLSGGMSNTAKARAKKAIQAVFTSAKRGNLRVSHATWEDRTKRVLRAYVDLHALGFIGLGLEGLRRHHLDALLTLWRFGGTDQYGVGAQKPMARASAANFWRVLCEWGLMIGKPGLVPDLATLWPALPRSSAARDPLSRQPVHGRRDSIHTMSDSEYSALLAAWSNNPTKRTHFWLVRTMRELGLTKREALMLEPYVSTVRRSGSLILKLEKSREDTRSVPVDTPEKAELLDALVGYLDGVGRTRLIWPVQRVKTRAQAERKLSSAVAYALVAIRRGGRPTATVASPGAEK